ncbi:MAG: methyltransferase domain-containing protein [Lysobacterales bacterium]|nr:MAG: methyltransferase domain-containing protein [Xanthomonadales bacterium]
MMANESEQEARFAFGRNWECFARVITEERITASEAGLQRALRCDNLKGMRFLDIGCGSGLSSLAALRLGAEVRAFDFDAESVATTHRVLERFAPTGAVFLVEQQSALDEAYMVGLGSFDVVYSWGVLHHTGGMWQGIQLAADRVAPSGRLMLALYNDQGGASRRWLAMKRLYVCGPKPVRWALVAAVGLWFEGRSMLIRLVRGQNPLPFTDWRKRKAERGMSVWHDLVDWVGGYPFEVAKPEEVLGFLKPRGFVLEAMSTCAGGHACNEFLFVKTTTPR